MHEIRNQVYMYMLIYFQLIRQNEKLTEFREILTQYNEIISDCLLTIGALWLMGTQNITYKIQVNGEGLAYYTEHIV